MGRTSGCKTGDSGGDCSLLPYRCIGTPLQRLSAAGRLSIRPDETLFIRASRWTGVFSP